MPSVSGYVQGGLNRVDLVSGEADARCNCHDSALSHRGLLLLLPELVFEDEAADVGGTRAAEEARSFVEVSDEVGRDVKGQMPVVCHG